MWVATDVPRILVVVFREKGLFGHRVVQQGVGAESASSIRSSVCSNEESGRSAHFGSLVLEDESVQRSRSVPVD